MLSRRQFLAGAAGLLLPVERKIERAYSFVGGWALGDEWPRNIVVAGDSVMSRDRIQRVVLYETTDYIDDSNYYANPGIRLTRAGAEFVERVLTSAP